MINKYDWANVDLCSIVFTVDYKSGSEEITEEINFKKFHQVY